MNDTTVWCQNGSVTESQRELDDPETIRFSLRIGVLMRFEFFACRDRRPRRPGNERIFNLQPAMIGSRIKSKICCFSGRRGRRPLQAKIQIALTRRYGAKTLSFPGRRGRRPLQAKIQTASIRRTCVFSPRREYGKSLGDPVAYGVALPVVGFDYASLRSG